MKGRGWRVSGVLVNTNQKAEVAEGDCWGR
jgi:hypothetical protein